MRFWLVLYSVACLASAMPTAQAVGGGFGEDDPCGAALAAGEFVTVLAAAEQRGGREGDSLLAALAQAQLEYGQRQASLYSAGQIRDDRYRAEVLNEITNRPWGGRGGAAEADFEAVIELITSTIAPNTWEEVGGPGAIQEFEGGVRVDPQGLMRPVVAKDPSSGLDLLLEESRPRRLRGDVRRQVPLRKISLTRLEKAVQLRLAAGKPPTEAMRLLAGMTRIKHLFVYPERGEVVVAGPAGEWQTGVERRIVNRENGEPVLRLEDMVVVLQAIGRGPEARFGCSITPTKEGLSRAKTFLDKWRRRSIPVGGREKWLATLREKLGQQRIELYGIPADSRAARVLVEADYRMKLVGMGIEPGVVGVESYLDALRKQPQAASMDVLRWWFTLNYDAVLRNEDRTAFELRGQGVQVLSENELLTATGRRIHTGKSDELNQQFSSSFTAKFPRLASKYPIYAELRNIFDLAMVAALMQQHDLPERADWHLTCFGSEGGLPLPQHPVPRMVDTVVSHREIGKTRFVAGVSGGVRVDPSRWLGQDRVKLDTYGRLQAEHSGGLPEEVAADRWWWD